MKKYLLTFILLMTPLFAQCALAATSYIIEKSIKDEIFVINNEVFSAKTYCFNIEDGDEVVFIEGNPYGACVSAQFIDLRTKKICDVWCE